MKLRNFKRIMSGFLAGALVLTSVPAASVSAAEVAVSGEVAVNPRVHYQTLEGWGTSMCWWGNVIGSWGDQDFNGNGRPDREEIAELAFSPEYLNLNIVRYNVGGGDKTPTSMKRVEGIVPGWTVDMTGSEDGSKPFNAEAFYAKDIKDMNDAGQLWMLDQANKYRAEAAKAEGRENDIINEVFSNSPPYYMTKSGSSTGGVNATSNLKEDCYDDFALYMARAGKWVDNYLNKTYGTGVDYIEPMNEPNTNYWGYGSTKQEGCTFDEGEEISNMLVEMKKALDAEELDIPIQGTDETSLGLAISGFKALTTEAKNTMSAIGAHTYGGSDAERETLRDLAASYDKTLWMSEITRGKDGNGHDTAHDSMSKANASGQSTSMMSDLKLMQPSAWVLWLVADSEYECLQVNGNWGLIHCVFEEDGPVEGYHTNLFNADGTVKDGVPGKGYWACTKQFYVMMQYSKYLKAGYTMIDIGDNDMCAAISPDGKELVIVANNFSTERNTTVDLTKFDKAGNAKVYRTSDDYSCELVETQDVSDKILDVTLPSNSVSTYVIEVEADTDNYTTSVTANVVTPSEEGIVVDDMNKFTLEGRWTGSTSVTAGAAATFKFEGNRALIYGTKSSRGALVNVSVDGGEEIEVDLNSATALADTMIFDTGDLEAGTHTVTMTMADGQKNKTFALTGAEIVHGELIVSGPVIRKVVNYDGALKIVFDEVKGSSGYTIKYGTSRRNLDQKVAISNTSAVLKGLENGRTYYVQIEDSLGGVSNIFAGVPGGDDTNVLYFVDAGTDDVNTPEAGDSLGKYNSNLDQVYGEDEITGKNWGYVDNTNGAEYRDGDALTSIRIDEQNTAGAGLEYKFDVPAGTYTVTVAMQDPWNNGGRYTDIVINGDTKATSLLPTSPIIKNYDVTMDADGEMSVKIVRSSDNSSEHSDPLVSYIIIAEKNVDENAISEVGTLPSVSTVAGVLPVLAETVSVTMTDGSSQDVAIEWNEYEGSDFAAFGEKVVKGTVSGTKFEVEQTVNIQKVDGKQTLYFIDCSNPTSTTHAELLDRAGLLNQVPDQAYEEGKTTWGYVEALGGSSPNAVEGEKFSTGWWAGSNQDIQYRIPLEAGSYNVYFGFEEWWNSTRPMQMMAYYDNKAIDLGVATISGSVLQLEDGGEISLSEAEDVILSVEKHNGPDPVLSYIQIDKTLDTAELKDALNRAIYLDKSEMDADTLANVNNTIADGMDTLVSVSATQDEIDAAAQAMVTVLGGVEGSILTGKKAELAAAVAEAKALDATLYTAASVAEYNQIVDTVNAVVESNTVTVAEIEKAKKTLADADTKLVTLESILLEALAYNAADNANNVFTAASWVVYEEALNAANALVGTSYTEDAMNEAIAALEAACDGLVNVSGISTVIEEAKAISADVYTAASYEALDTAIKAAEAALASPEQTALDEAEKALKVAMRGLVTIESILTKAIKKYTADNSKGIYSEASWTVYDNAFGAALVLGENGYTEETVNAAVAALKDAYNALVKVEDLFSEALNEVKVTDSSIYTAESWKAYEDAYKAANDLYTSKKYTEADMNAAIAKVKTAITGLAKASDVVKVASIKLTNEFEANKLQIAAGKKVALYAEVLPSNAVNKEVVWSSSDENIAKVNPATGVVTTGKKAGGKKAVITATAKDGSGVTATVTVQVMKGAVKKIAIKGKKTVSVKAGRTVTIKTKVTKAKKSNAKLMWKSSKPEIATVNAKGRVKVVKGAKKGQKAVITVMATDGSNKKAKVTIKVK